MATLLIDELAAWLADEADLVLGEDLFTGLLPEVATAVALLKDTGGPGRTFSPVETQTFQVLARGPGFDATMALSRALYDAVYPPPSHLPARNVDLGHWQALAIDAIQGPTDLGVTESGLRQVVFNLGVKAVNANGSD